MNFLLFILTQACKEFEQRVGQIKSPRGEKTALVEGAMPGNMDRSACPISKRLPECECGLIRSVLKRLKGASIECLGRGPHRKMEENRK